MAQRSMMFCATSVISESDYIEIGQEIGQWQTRLEATPAPCATCDATEGLIFGVTPSICARCYVETHQTPEPIHANRAIKLRG